MTTFGVYPVADVLTAGDEISSTYEGRHVTLLENELIHNVHGDGLVDKGDPVIFGTVAKQGVGVAFKSAVADTDLIAVDTEGIWVIDCFAQDDGGASAIEGGDRLYIANSSPCVVSKIATAATQVPFGYALGHVDAGLTETIAVKVHWDPIDNAILDNEPFRIGDGADATITWVDPYLQFRATVATPAHVDAEGFYNFAMDVTGIATGEVNMTSHWINLTDAADVPGYMHVHTDGIWGSAADLATAYIAWAKISWMLPENPAGLYLFELNNGGAFDALDAIFAVNNPALALGYVAATPTAAASGSIPFFAGAGGGGGLKWIRTYDDATT